MGVEGTGVWEAVAARVGESGKGVWAYDFFQVGLAGDGVGAWVCVCGHDKFQTTPPHITSPQKLNTNTHTQAHVLLEQHQSQEALQVLRRLRRLFPASSYLIVRLFI